MTIGKVAVEDIARRHIEYIKSGGEKGVQCDGRFDDL